MNPTEAGVLQKAEGGATNNWIKTKVDGTGDKMVDQFTAEAAALVKANPLGSDPLEKTGCSAFAADFAKFAKGTALYKKKSRK